MNTEKEAFGSECIEQFLARHGNALCSAQEIAQNLTTEDRDYAGDVQQYDDVTLVAVKVL
jgi:serine phosphatase RsbU (regulator of sigma subunit)